MLEPFLLVTKFTIPPLRAQLLTNASIFWFAGASSANALYEDMQAYRTMIAQQSQKADAYEGEPSRVPTGVAVFAADTTIRSVFDPGTRIKHWLSGKPCESPCLRGRQESLTKASNEPNKMTQFTAILLQEKRLSRTFLHSLPYSPNIEWSLIEATTSQPWKSPNCSWATSRHSSARFDDWGIHEERVLFGRCFHQQHVRVIDPLSYNRNIKE